MSETRRSYAAHKIATNPDLTFSNKQKRIAEMQSKFSSSFSASDPAFARFIQVNNCHRCVQALPLHSPTPTKLRQQQRTRNAETFVCGRQLDAPF